jgi:hypothetical protein
VTDLVPARDDLFDDPAPRYGLDPVAGRYRFPPPPGFEPSNRGWRRTTNLVKAFSDQYALQQWLERMTLLGLLANEGLVFDELAASGVEYQPVDVQRKQLADFASRARSAVGADTGSRKGTARHAVLERYLFAGEEIGHRRMRAQFAELRAVMDRKGFEFIPGTQESFVFHPIAGGVVGRRDVRFLCTKTGQIGTIDLKTQERFWTYQEHAGQQWIYDTAPLVWEGPLDDSGRWVAQEAGTYVGRPGGACPGERAALLAHVPSKGGPVDVHEVNLDYGGHVARQAAIIIELRAQGKKIGGICPERRLDTDTHGHAIVVS